MKRLFQILLIITLAGTPSAFSFDGPRDPDRHDVNDKAYTSTVLTVGVTQVEVKVGGTRNALRQRVFIYNDSNSSCRYGPNGVTMTGSTRGIQVFKRQVVAVPIGDVALYLICGSAGNEFVIQELQ